MYVIKINDFFNGKTNRSLKALSRLAHNYMYRNEREVAHSA